MNEKKEDNQFLYLLKELYVLFRQSRPRNNELWQTSLTWAQPSVTFYSQIPTIMLWTLSQPGGPSQGPQKQSSASASATTTSSSAGELLIN